MSVLGVDSSSVPVLCVDSSLVSLHMGPVNPGAQVHSNVLGELLHVPLLRQGTERHMFKSFSQFLPYKHMSDHQQLLLVCSRELYICMHVAYIIVLWTGALVVVQEVAAVSSILAGLWETVVNHILTLTTEVTLLAQTLIIIKAIL